MKTITEQIDVLQKTRTIGQESLTALLHADDAEAELCRRADRERRKYYGDKVFIRGLIEFTNYCKNNCFYCGIRHDNKDATRYRLSEDDINACCKEGYALGFRTFVLQGGEDDFYTDAMICRIVSGIRSKYPDCAITLSIGEKSRESYLAYFRAGANRYLLRHETADAAHYARLHPHGMSLARRKQCLYDLKEIGYQVGSGFMVGSPFQTDETLWEDLMFLKKLQPVSFYRLCFWLYFCFCFILPM